MLNSRTKVPLEQPLQQLLVHAAVVRRDGGEHPSQGERRVEDEGDGGAGQHPERNDRDLQRLGRAKLGGRGREETDRIGRATQALPQCCTGAAQVAQVERVAQVAWVE